MKSYTTIEQSHKLAEILPLESADMHSEAKDIDGDMVFIVVSGLGDKTKSNYGSPVWSLTALLGVLPEGMIESYYIPNLQKENGKYSVAYGSDELLCTADNPVDACYEMIVKLHELNLL